jgi:hypothetical protein
LDRRNETETVHETAGLKSDDGADDYDDDDDNDDDGDATIVAAAADDDFELIFKTISL